MSNKRPPEWWELRKFWRCGFPSDCSWWHKVRYFRAAWWSVFPLSRAAWVRAEENRLTRDEYERQRQEMRAALGWPMRAGPPPCDVAPEIRRLRRKAGELDAT